ncbi:MAG: HEAT repeat domain-containing protein [Planctomycetes bacterium]|nr:HEAT repeat domain-containing protein [Planctomycetota bacterium]
MARNRGLHVNRLARRGRIEQGEEELPVGWKPRIERWWATWCRRPKDVDPTLVSFPDPVRLRAARVVLRREWVQSRTEWVALGPGAVNILVENLLSWYVRAYDANSGSEVDRAKLEIGLFKDEAIPYLVSGLGRSLGDSVVRTRLGELLATFGETPVPAIEEEWGRASDDGRLALVKAMKQMRSQGTVPLLKQVAGDEDAPWKTRIEAIGALGKMEVRTCGVVFRQCLRDDDVSVRKFAALHMHQVTDGGLADKEALVGAMDDALREGNRPVAQACRNALCAITEKRLPVDPARWRAVIRRDGKD